MKRFWGAITCVLLMVSGADAQVTRVATFENFSAGQEFKPSFTDPLSGITFRNSTLGDFVIDFYPPYFGSGNYLTSGAIGVGGLGGGFGFAADLPSAANSVNLAAIYQADTRSHVTLQGLNALGNVVAQQSGPSGLSGDSFPLLVTSNQFDIVSFRVVAGGGFAGYDNIAITVAPEPMITSWIVFAGVMAFGRRHRRCAKSLRIP